ncbi:MAG: Single-stranded-DNA-specific exonuclease RecJ [Gammaproteobacteria bacterium]|nr:Single-stranded-DNA-specific exonuclease RecJ [Gammaproteobacteria bacterium]
MLAAIAVEHEEVIDKFGGHAMAAGLSIEPEQLERFEALFDETTARLGADVLNQVRVLYTDGPLHEDDLTVENAKLLREHGPWGQGFPEPLFDDTFEVLERGTVGKGFLRYKLRKPGCKKVIAGICFDPPGGESSPDPKNEIHAVYRLAVNDYAGRQTAQLILEHIL